MGTAAETTTLLIADDEEDIRELLVGAFEKSHKVMTANDGEQALELIKTQKIHAVLTDVRMPRLSGIDLMRATRALGKEIPFVFLSGNASRHDLVQAVNLGAIEFIDKPFEIRDVQASVEKALELGLYMAKVQDEIDQFPAEDDAEEKDAHRIVVIHRAMMLMRKEKRKKAG